MLRTKLVPFTTVDNTCLGMPTVELSKVIVSNTLVLVFVISTVSPKIKFESSACCVTSISVIAPGAKFGTMTASFPLNFPFCPTIL